METSQQRLPRPLPANPEQMRTQIRNKLSDKYDSQIRRKSAIPIEGGQAGTRDTGDSRYSLWIGRFRTAIKFELVLRFANFGKLPVRLVRL